MESFYSRTIVSDDAVGRRIFFMRRLVYASAAVVVITAMCGICAYALSGSVERLSLADLVTRLETGEIAAGDEPPARMPKSWVEDGRTNEKGDIHGVAVLRDSDSVLFLYVHREKESLDAKLYGACLVQMLVDEPVRWFFCDRELMAEHLRLFAVER